MSGTGARRPATRHRHRLARLGRASHPVANLALELAPIRVNLIAPGFVDTLCRRDPRRRPRQRAASELRSTLPIGRVVGPDGRRRARRASDDQTPRITGATFDIDGGQQLVA
jgi:NAD(P)-dependent dehydrogenase (short-subunit alcohol dehydrogenase family)